jgi:hypothetical protein
MYAHKLFNNVEYTEWDRNAKGLKYALGRTLFQCFEYAKDNPKPVIDDYKALREELMMYKGGAKMGTSEKATSYKMAKWGDIPADIMRMELQTWIANAELRDESAMILDMWDWSNIPAPLDIKPNQPPEAATRSIPLDF